jgi:hypothetical protein
MQNTVLVRSSGQLVPDDYAKLFLQDTGSIGVAVHKDGKLLVDRVSFDTANPSYTVPEFKELQEAYKDSVAVYFSSKDDRDTESLQPYTVLVDDKDQPAVVLFLDGEFNQFVVKDSAHSEDYWAAEKAIIPFIKKIWTGDAKQDVAKLLNELNDPMVRMMLENCLTEKGTATLMSNAWAPITLYKKEPTGSTFPWGWVSDTHGYTEAPPKVQSGEGLLRRRRDLSGTVAPTKPVEEPKIAETIPQTDIEAAQNELLERETEHEMIGPPDELRGKRRSNWFEQHCTYKPSNWYDLGVKAPAKKTFKSLQDLPKPKAETEIKHTHTVVETPATGPKTIEDAVASLTDKEEIELKSAIVTLDRNSQKMPDDPKQIQALEAKFGNFFEILSLTESYLDGKPFEWYVGLGKINPKALALLTFNLKNIIREKDHDIEVLSAPPDKVDTSGTGTLKETAAEEQPRGGLLRRRARG